MSYKVKDNKSEVTLQEPYDVYEYLVENIYKQKLEKVDKETHLSAVDVQCWCELANVGDEYITSKFKVECVYNF